jgi:pectate lyase
MHLALAALIPLLLLASVAGATAQDRAAWNTFAKQPDTWYRSDDGWRITKNILSWQAAEGAWPKNQDNTAKPFVGDRKTIKGTFDNGATTDELRFLARAFRVTKSRRCQKAFLKGFDHILKAQYPSGGWPQFYPPDRHYHRHITFNDHAMARLMSFLREAATSDDYRFVDAKRRRAAQASFDRGIQCILKCQIVVNGKPTVWCAQHDEVDYSPRPGRSFELVSLSGCESVQILQLLMNLDQPSPEVCRAIQGAAEWFEAAKLTGIRVERVNGDQRVVPDPDAPPLWARFYEIETDRPIFCGRDGVKKYALAEIELERRSHYAWYGEWGRPLAGEYARWKAKWLLPESATTNKTLRLVIIGDSTVCEYAATNDCRGWGMFIQDYCKDSVRVFNLARSGRSSKSFITEGLWQKALDAKPDFVLIQFGHNDAHARTEPKATDAATDFRDYLRRYIQEARSIGATPILVTPMHRRTFTPDGKLNDNLKPYADAIRAVAAETKVAEIDLHAKSGKLFEKLGEAGIMEFANRADDRTHFNEKGAKAMADLVMQELRLVEPALKPYLK